jgi:AraC-like DNA-binding protein
VGDRDHLTVATKTYAFPEWVDVVSDVFARVLEDANDVSVDPVADRHGALEWVASYVREEGEDARWLTVPITPEINAAASDQKLFLSAWHLTPDASEVLEPTIVSRGVRWPTSRKVVEAVCDVMARSQREPEFLRAGERLHRARQRFDDAVELAEGRGIGLRASRASAREAAVDRKRALFDEAVELIEREPVGSLDLDSVARSLATSRRQLQRAFNEIGGTTFRAYALEVRIREARELLRETDMSVREIAERVGYRKPGQFQVAFRRQHGSLPDDFREHVRETPSPSDRASG